MSVLELNNCNVYLNQVELGDDRGMLANRLEGIVPEEDRILSFLIANASLLVCGRRGLLPEA